MVKISVIIPVYNTEKYLKECLDSVISQTLTDIEIICIDDGSTDNSLEILKEYANKDNRFTIVKQENMGSGTARNCGLNISKGVFVAFMDADDKYPYRETLEHLYKKAKENNVLICGGEFSHFTNENSALIQNYTYSQQGYLFEKNCKMAYRDYQFDYGYHRFIYNREFLLKNNLFFPNYRRYQDPPFLVKAMFIAKEFYAIKKTTYAYRIGHNCVKWNSVKTNDMLMGILDNMKFAFDNEMETLNEYSFIRLKQHYPRVKDTIDLKSILILNKMTKFNKEVKVFNKEYKLTIIQHYILPVLRSIFSVRNCENKRHKVITILGIKLKISKKIK